MSKEVFDWINAKLEMDKIGPAEDFDLSKLTPQDWKKIVSRCDSIYDWDELLRLKPEFADRCPREEFSGEDWSYLLCNLPDSPLADQELADSSVFSATVR